MMTAMSDAKLLTYIQIFFYGVLSLGVVLGCVRYLYNWFYDYRRMGHVVEDIALTHLPYLHKAVAKIGTALGVEMDEPPKITFYKRTPPQAVVPSEVKNGYY